jgi:itaconate CoA-transferase
VKGKRRVVLSLEQALSLPYATLRFVHLGWRVIRVEPTPVPGRKARGDPNRSIGRPVAGEDRHSYFVAPNVGKEAIALDLKSEEGRALLGRLLDELQVDVFCTNILPSRHASLGIDSETLRARRKELVWCGISAMGHEYADVPGYDPVTQALCGYMDLTGDPEGPPLQCGLPITDLKAGDEAFAQVLLALLERSETGEGRKIDVSMAHAAVSWLQTFLPMLEMGSAPSEIKRSGNEHRQFIPTNAYRTRDGFIYAAIGSDAQWERFVALPLFASLRRPDLATNEGRRCARAELRRSIEALTSRHDAALVAAALASAEIPNAPITPIERVLDLPFVAESATRTTTPDGKTVRLPPPAVSTPFLEERGRALPFAPRYGEHTDAILAEAGLDAGEIAALRSRGVVA